jgi:hypothetical protein
MELAPLAGGRSRLNLRHHDDRAQEAGTSISAGQATLHGASANGPPHSKQPTS